MRPCNYILCKRVVNFLDVVVILVKAVSFLSSVLVGWIKRVVIRVKLKSVIVVAVSGTSV